MTHIRSACSFVLAPLATLAMSATFATCAKFEPTLSAQELSPPSVSAQDSLPQGSGVQETAAPEGAVIGSVDVSGIGRDRLSHGLRTDIAALEGAALEYERLRELAARIEAEHPEMVTAVRTVALADGVAQVIFFVGRISDDRDLASNINARYVVERVEIEGVPEQDVTPELRTALAGLEGRALDADETERLEEQLAGEFPDYDVERRMRRGTERGRIRLVFELDRLESTRWIPFAESRSKIVFHESQGWSGVLDVPIGAPRNHRFTIGLAFGNDDDLVEEYSGFRFRLENVEVGTERLGLSLELARMESSWRDVTLTAVAANPDIPAAYDHRLTVSPAVTFAPVRRLRLLAGVSVSELAPLAAAEPEDSRVASAVTASAVTASAVTAGAAFDREWRQAGRGSHDVAAGYSLRVGAAGLDSDLRYRRHHGEVRYRYEHGDSAVIARAAAGYISGRAPLFERFTLGDSSTLRGWNKYDIAPAGADRLIHQSVEYRYHAIALFLDTGAVWEQDGVAELRYSTGIGLHSDHAFITIGVPLDAGRVNAAVMLGVRF